MAKKKRYLPGRTSADYGKIIKIPYLPDHIICTDILSQGVRYFDKSTYRLISRENVRKLIPDQQLIEPTKTWMPWNQQKAYDNEKIELNAKLAEKIKTNPNPTIADPKDVLVDLQNHAQKVTAQKQKKEQEKNAIISQCSVDLATFAAVFLSQHITRPFAHFHLQTLTDLYWLITGKRPDHVLHATTPPPQHTPTTEENKQKINNLKPYILNNLNSLEGEGGQATTGMMASNLPPTNFSEQKVTLDNMSSDQNTEDNNNEELVSTAPESEKIKKEDILENGTETELKLHKYEAPENLRGRLERLVVAAPRGHAKSTLVSLVTILWCVVFRITKFIVLVSDSEDQAKLLLSAVRAELEGNDLLRGVFGDLVNSDGVWGDLALETKNNVRVQVRGTGQRIRGLKYQNERPGLIIVDDCESDEQMESDEQRDKLKRWFYATLLPSLKQDGRIIVIGTILHEDSLLSNLLHSWPSRRYGATEDGTLQGKPIWPSCWTTEKLQETFQDYKQRGFQDLFWKEYFNRIVSPEESIFKEELFQYTEEVEIINRANKGEAFRTFLTCDPAISIDQGRDFTAFSIVYVDHRNIMYVKEIRRGRWPIPQTIEILFELQKEYQPDGIGIQRIDWDRMLKVPVTTEMRRQERFFRVTPLQTYSALNRGMASKKNRIMRLAPRYHAGQIFHIKNAKGIYYLEDELKGFPNTRYDDVSDCVSMQLDLIFPGKEKEERKENALDKISNSISGY